MSPAKKKDQPTTVPSSPPVPTEPEPETDPTPTSGYDELMADVGVDDTASEPDVGVGQLITHSQFDAYRGAGGEDVDRLGLVVAVDEDDDGRRGARIVWFDALSDPIDLDELTVVE